MKKLLGILVLGLLLVGCAPAAYEAYDGSGKLKIHVDKLAGSKFLEIKSEADRFCQSANRGNSINVRKTGSDILNISWDEYEFDCDKTQKAIANEKKQAEEKENQVKMTSLIDKAKDTCKSLDFTEGTEKFSDCALKLYSQNVELAAKQNQQIVSQGLGSNVVTIYDPRRDSRAAIKRGQGLINGTCTLGDLSNC